MRGNLVGLVNAQRGIFARHQALAAGYSEKEFQSLTHSGSGPWIRVRYGIYAVRDTWQGLTPRGRQGLVDRAALLVCDQGTVLSHSSAARLLGLPLYDADDGLVHVTRLPIGGRRLSRRQAGIHHHCGRLHDDEIVTMDGVRVTSPARTALDVASVYGYRSGLVLADAALHSGVARGELETCLIRYPHDQHAPLRRAVIADADGRAESPLETLARILLVAMGIRDLELQYSVQFSERGRADVDLYSPELHHIFECDGRMKYRTQVTWRGDSVDADQIVWDEKVREDKLRGQNYGVSRIRWSDTMVDSFDVASTRLWREIRSQHAALTARRLPKTDLA